MSIVRTGRRTQVRVAMLASVVSLGMLAACSGAPDGSMTSMPASSSAPPVVSSQGSTAPLESLSAPRLSPIYWLGERDSTVYLYREYVEAEDQGDPVTTAIKYLTEQQPEDPDYFNVWSKPSRIGTSISADNVITLDISADAFSRDLDEGLAQRAIQQLVYTATAAASAAGLLSQNPPASVDLLVDGHSGYNAFGHVKLTGPIQRDASLRAPIWIIDPQQGTVHSAGKVRLHGISGAFPGGTHWVLKRQEDGKGTRVAGGSLALGGGSLADNEFEVTPVLEAGTYTLAVWGQAADDGKRLSQDTKKFTVR
ncbi:GerMN domain-containing protein [Arthrobacter sp. JSM 101049]|uniref:GerMN domain-containing protein n=1 Tax=Arthrobacter sp. JSM 101049 TaxID=929097 RepID=UPI00356ACA0E